LRRREQIVSHGHLAEQVNGDLPVSGVSVTTERLFQSSDDGELLVHAQLRRT
jgi:hypothetical protein